MDIVRQVKKLLELGKVDIFLGYKEIDNHLVPHGFTKENMDELKKHQELRHKEFFAKFEKDTTS